MKHFPKSALTKTLFFLLLPLLCATPSPALAAPTLDVDGNGTVDGGTDGLLVNRYLYGFRGDALIDGAVGSGCVRCSAAEIEAYLASLAGGGGGEDTFTNSLGMTFVRIPAGTFMMGSPEDELGSFGWEKPKHQVTLTQDYFMQTTEVTQAQWKAVMGSNPSDFSNCGGECPVETVSWNDVQDFITALSGMDEYTYRLPTEAEWEYAARAGTTTAFYNGGIAEEECGLDPNLDAIGWYCGNSGDTTHPVAQKQPNAWGLYDMSGNVWEWVQDFYGDYPANASVDPSGPSEAFDRVIRGGSWINDARYCRSAYRYGSIPTDRNDAFGFRLALSPGR